MEELAFDEQKFSLKHSQGTIFLTNFYDHYCKADRADRKGILHKYISVLLQPHEDTLRAEAFEQCVAVIRERALFEFLDLQRQIDHTDPNPVARETVSEWYVRCLVLDAPTHMKMVTQENLKEWGVTFDELFEVGLERLKECTTPQFQPEDGYFIGTWKDDYDSSRILLPELFEDLPIAGQPVFCLPNRLTLLVANSDKPAAIKAMLERAEAIMQSEAKPQNSAPLTYQDGRIVDFSPAPDSELFAPVQYAKALAAITYYEEQKNLLEQLHEKTGKDIYVGQFTAVRTPTGQTRTFAVWLKGVVTLLPKADAVMFRGQDLPKEDQMLGMVKWEDVVAVASDLMLDTEMSPARFYVSKFPTEEQIARMPKLLEDRGPKRYNMKS